MKIRKLEIRNFRGVSELDWSLPKGSHLLSDWDGASSKSTILEAIRSTFHPQWNLTLSDTDFHNSNIENPMIIEAMVGELVDDFCSLAKYGHYLRRWDSDAFQINYEPDDHLETVLTRSSATGATLGWRLQNWLPGAGPSSVESSLCFLALSLP